MRVEYPQGNIRALAARLGRAIGSVAQRAAWLKLSVLPEKRSYSRQQPKGPASAGFTGYGRVSGSYMNQLRGNLPTGRQFAVTAQYLDSIAIDICPLSGRPLTYGVRASGGTHTASLDRIDSTKGYVEGNVRWIHKTVNIMRSNMTDDAFLSWVNDIAQHYHA